NRLFAGTAPDDPQHHPSRLRGWHRRNGQPKSRRHRTQPENVVSAQLLGHFSRGQTVELDPISGLGACRGKIDLAICTLKKGWLLRVCEGVRRGLPNHEWMPRDDAAPGNRKREEGRKSRRELPLPAEIDTLFLQFDVLGIEIESETAPGGKSGKKSDE